MLLDKASDVILRHSADSCFLHSRGYFVTQKCFTSKGAPSNSCVSNNVTRYPSIGSDHSPFEHILTENIFFLTSFYRSISGYPQSSIMCYSGRGFHFLHKRIFAGEISPGRVGGRACWQKNAISETVFDLLSFPCCSGVFICKQSPTAVCLTAIKRI